MSRFFKFVDLNASLDEDRKRERPIEWSKCVLCQMITDEEPIDPSQNKKQKKGEGYDTLDRNLVQFDCLGKIPWAVNLQELCQGPGMKENLAAHEAKYHKSCYLKITDSKLAKAKQSLDKENLPPPASSVPTRRSSGLSIQQNQICCFLCGKKGDVQCVNMEKGGLALQNHAAKQGDTKVLVALQNQSWVHRKCRSAYVYQPAPAEESSARSAARDVALSHVIEHVNAVRDAATDSPVFPMAQLTTIYNLKLKELGVEVAAHSTRLKEQLLESCPYLEASGTAGQSSLVRFTSDVDVSIRRECSLNCGPTNLAEAVEEIRGDILNHTAPTWEDMSAECEKTCVPASLRSLVSLLVDGSTDNASDDQVVSTISQLVYFHARRRKQGKSRRHDASRETPMPVYWAMKLYGDSRGKELIDTAFKLGISISYDRVHTILRDRSNRACQQYKEEKVVCLITLERNAFTTGQVDNIDHNTSSMSSKSAFHGTAISLMQHGPRGEPRQKSLVYPQSRRVAELPADYLVVVPTFLDSKNARCPASEVASVNLDSTTDPLLQETEWLEACRGTSTCETWPAHHSKCVSGGIISRCTVLPVFREKSQDMSMMCHSMRLVMKATKFLNPLQVPVIVADQPLYALCKQAQWLNPDEFGEDKIFAVLGKLHIELAAMRVVGDWLDGCGWSSALVHAGITTAGRADSLVSVNHVTRSRYAHQVTLGALYDLQRKAYEDYGDDDPLTFEEWCEAKRSSHPQFRFWDIAKKMELIVLQIVRAIRTADFTLFNEAISRMVPFFFALDHQNYARWLPVHIRDNINVERMHPTLWQKFKEGYFVANRSERRFSSIGLDQAHEQMNAVLKGSGGMVGLTEDPCALLKWMLSAPEVAEVTTRFESNILKLNGDPTELHHFDSDFARTMFLRDKAALVVYFETAGNPFAEESLELYNIETRKCCDKKVIETVMTIEQLGNEQYAKFVNERLEKTTVSIHEKISRNSLATFARLPPKSGKMDKTKQQIKTLKGEVNLFSHMWVAISNNRPGNLDEFFSYEHHEYPPALATPDGKMRKTSKADLVSHCLAPLAASEPPSAPPVDAKVLDGAAMVHLLRPGLSVLFSDYADKVFIPMIVRESSSVARLDVVWDVYLDKSLKDSTRAQRGEGVRVRVARDTKIPKDWPRFLKNTENKEELFSLLSDAIVTAKAGDTELYSTKGNLAVSNSEREDLSDISPCNHEEADTRVFVHVADADRRGSHRVMIRAMDSDIVALACGVMPTLPCLRELWVHRPTSKDHRFIAVHEICETLGPQKSLAVAAWHALTGCDNTGAFFGIGKKTAWNALNLQPEAIDALLMLSEGKTDESHLQLEKLVIAMYSPTEQHQSVNKCRRAMISSTNRPLESIPPTEDALKLHFKRASYQAHVWSQLTVPLQVVGSPADYGWKEQQDAWEPVWRSQPKSSLTCKTLVKCGCKVKCGEGNCKCKAVGCIDLCTCVCKKK